MGFLSFILSFIKIILSFIGYLILEFFIFLILYTSLNDMGYFLLSKSLLILFIIWIIVDLISRIIGVTVKSIFNFFIGRFIK